MELIPREDFLEWLGECDIVVQDGYPGKGHLFFRDDSARVRRRWDTPSPPSELPGFVSSLMQAAAPEGRLYVSVRGGEPWLEGIGYNEGPLVDQLRERIIQTLPVPLNFSGALRFEVAEWRDVMILLITSLVYGYVPPHDLDLVPEDRSCLLRTSHDGFIEIDSRDAARAQALKRYV